MVHTGTRQLKIIWNLIQENSEDNYEFSSAEKHALRGGRKGLRYCGIGLFLFQSTVLRFSESKRSAVSSNLMSR